MKIQQSYDVKNQSDYGKELIVMFCIPQKIDFRYAIIGLWLILSVGSSQRLLAQPAILMERDVELEKLVWLTESKRIGDVETRVVRNIQENPRSAFDHYLLAHIYVRKYASSPADLSLLKKSTDLAQQAIELEPGTDFGYAALSQVLDLMGQSSAAINMLDATANPSVNFGWKKWFLTAKFSSEKLTGNQILEHLEKAMLMRDSQQEVIVPYIVAVLRGTSEDEAFVANLRAWDQKYPSYLFKESIANALSDLGRYEEAHNSYVEAYSPSFNRVRPIVNDGILLYKYLGSRDKAKLMFEYVIGRSSKQASKDELSVAHAHMGVILLSEGKGDQASQHFISSIKLNSDAQLALDFVVSSFKSADAYAPLTGFLTLATQELAGTGAIYALLGGALSENIGDHDQAIEAYGNAIVLEPSRTDYYNGLGLTLYRKNAYSQALRVFTQATKIDPEDATSWYNAACVLAKMQQYADALEALKEAIALDPGLKQTALADSDFEGLLQNAQFVEILKNHEHVHEVKFGH